MLKHIPTFKRGEFKKFLKKLPLKDKKVLKDYSKYCSINADKMKVLDMERNVLKFRIVMDKDFHKITLKDLRNYLVILNKSKISDYSKNDIKVHIKKLLKWKFKDWSKRFEELKDIKQNVNAQRKKKIDEKTILSKRDIEKMMKTETKMFWKAFFITQYEGALRTKECRLLKWDSLKEENEFYTIDLHATKTNKNRFIILKSAKYYLDKLKEEQQNTKNKGIYIFHSKNDVNKPIDKATVSVWIRNLSKKALGREIWAYILRHTRASELRKMVKEGKLSKDNALEFMGHSEKQFDKVYSHLDKEDVKEMIKEQIYQFEELPPEEKHKLEKEVGKLKKIMVILSKKSKKYDVVGEISSEEAELLDDLEQDTI